LAGTPRASCAAIVCGPAPCDAPDPVVTLMPLVRSNSGNSRSYAPLNPPDIRTFSCVDDAAGQSGAVATMTNEKVSMIGSSPARLHACDETIAHHAGQEAAALEISIALNLRRARRRAGGRDQLPLDSVHAALRTSLKCRLLRLLVGVD